MDFNLDHQKSEICIKHTQPIVIINNDGHFCLVCLQQLPGNISIEQFKQQQQEMIDQIIKQIDLDHQLLQELLEQLLKFKNAIISSLDKICQQIYNQIKNIQESKSKISIIRQSHQDLKSMVNEVELVSNKQQQFNKDAKNQIKKQLQSFQLQFAEINQHYRFSEDNSIVVQQQVVGMMESKIQINEVQVENARQKFQYELIKQSSMKQEKFCYSFEFNKDNTILVIGYDSKIILYEFMNGIIQKELQRLNNHTNIVNCLYFMKQSNSFVSGSSDNSIIIWIQDKNNKWIAQQQLKEQNCRVNCILMNKMEDQLILGSVNCTLKFWKKKTNFLRIFTASWTCSKNIPTKYQVYNVSLNEKEDKLIVCENNYEYEQQTQKMSCVQVLIQQNNEEWNLVQTIDNQELGQRLSFTIGDQFVFATDNLKVYDYDTVKRKFVVVSQIKIQNVKQCCGFFPCQFIKSQNILTYKHGQFINIIKVNEEYDYQLVQAIDLDNCYSKGRMTNDGEYLVTWDSKSKEVQSRKIKQQD